MHQDTLGIPQYTDQDPEWHSLAHPVFYGQLIVRCKLIEIVKLSIDAPPVSLVVSEALRLLSTVHLWHIVDSLSLGMPQHGRIVPVCLMDS